jgi:hypothetical protein
MAGSIATRRLHLLCAVIVLQACAGTHGEVACEAMPEHVISTHGGAEDMVVLPLDGGRMRLLVRETSHGSDAEQGRIGRVDVGPGLDPRSTEPAWRPPKGEPFEPLGMSLTPDGAFLFVLDLAKDVRIWRLEIAQDKHVAAGQLWLAETEQLAGANNLAAVDSRTVFVSHFDPLGSLPWRKGGWYGVLKVSGTGKGQRIDPLPHTDGLRGANGIIALPGTSNLIVSDYHGRRLMWVGQDPTTGTVADATATLPVHPDNLTLDDKRILIAGQRSFLLAALNLALNRIPSPSAVLAIDTDALDDQATPHLLWRGGWSFGRSVSVAVPGPGGGLMLGQISNPGILQVACRPG